MKTKQKAKSVVNAGSTERTPCAVPSVQRVSEKDKQTVNRTKAGSVLDSVGKPITDYEVGLMLHIIGSADCENLTNEWMTKVATHVHTQISAALPTAIESARNIIMDPMASVRQNPGEANIQFFLTLHFETSQQDVDAAEVITKTITTLFDELEKVNLQLSVRDNNNVCKSLQFKINGGRVTALEDLAKPSPEYLQLMKQRQMMGRRN